MKTKNILVQALIPVLCLTACSTEDELVSSDIGKTLKITASFGGDTRTDPMAESVSGFDKGDQIFIVEGTDPMNTTGKSDIYTFNGLEWTSNGKIKCTSDNINLIAHTPASFDYLNETFPTDQSTLEKLKKADFSYCQGSYPITDGGVSLNFSRNTARLRFNLFITRELKNPKVKSFTVFASNNIFNTPETQNIVAFTPYAKENAYTVLVQDTYKDPAATFVRVEVSYTIPESPDEQTRVYLLKGIPDLGVGDNYTYNLSAGKKTLEISSIQITPWGVGAEGSLNTDETVPEDPTPVVDVPGNLITTKYAGYLTEDIIIKAINGRDELFIEGPLNGADLNVLRNTLDKNNGKPALTRVSLYRARIVPDVDENAGDYPHVVTANCLPQSALVNVNTGQFSLPGTLKSVGKYCFQGSTIQNVNLNCEEVQDEAFRDCLNLRFVNFNLKNAVFGANVFMNTPKLQRVTLEIGSHNNLSDNTFGNNPEARPELVIDDALIGSAEGPQPDGTGCFIWYGGTWSKVIPQSSLQYD